MQSGDVFARPPVAAPQRVPVEDVECGAQAPSAPVSEHEQQVCGQRRADFVEEVERKVGGGVVRPVGALVAFEEERAIRGVDVGADLAHERDARLGEAPPLLADLLALFVIEHAEEGGEVAVAAVAPMELQPVAREHAGGGAFARLRLVGEQHMQRRIAVAQLRERVLEQRAARRRVGREQPRSGHRSEGNRGDELRVIAASVTSIGVGPAPIEHVLAVAVCLRVQRERAGKRRLRPRGEEARLPAGLPRRASRLVQRGEIGVRQQRGMRREPIPLFGLDRR